MFIARRQRFPKLNAELYKLDNAGSINIWLLTEPELFDRDQLSQRAKALVAETANHYEVLGPAKRAVLFSMLDDPLSEARANAGQLLKLLGGRGVDIDSRWGGVFRSALVRWRGCGRQLIRQTAFALTFDA